MELSEPKWVNSNYISYGVNSLRLGGLQMHNSIWSHISFKPILTDRIHICTTSHFSQFSCFSSNFYEVQQDRLIKLPKTIETKFLMVTLLCLVSLQKLPLIFIFHILGSKKFLTFLNHSAKFLFLYKLKESLEIKIEKKIIWKIFEGYICKYGTCR